jgi:SWIM zinc finger
VAGDNVTHAGCPQWWCAFAVRGDTGTYEVYADDVRRGAWRCSCPAWRFRGRATCKHIERVHRHGCFGAGPNNLRAFGVEITGENPMCAAQRTRWRCACGQMMLAPLMRMRDDAGHQIVEVWFGGANLYTYAWAGRVLALGDVVEGGGVVALGSDYLGELKVIGERRA